MCLSLPDRGGWTHYLMCFFFHSLFSPFLSPCDVRCTCQKDELGDMRKVSCLADKRDRELERDEGGGGIFFPLILL